MLKEYNGFSHYYRYDLSYYRPLLLSLGYMYLQVTLQWTVGTQSYSMLLPRDLGAGGAHQFIVKHAKPYDGGEMYYLQTHLRLHKIFYVY